MKIPRSLRSCPPERRTRGDLLVAAAIVVVIAVAAGLIWWSSDARATLSKPAAEPVPALKAARDIPTSLREAWTAASPKTSRPVVAGGSVVTGDGTEVDGRDPATGNVLWSYARGVPLCGVTYVYNDAVAVYPDDRGCGQVTTIDGQTGRRHYSRTAYADPAVTLSSDGSTVLSAGDSRIELWRSDMVRMIGYGTLDARIKPDVPAQPLCGMVSAAASSTAVSVLQKCPGQADLRLTLLVPADQEDEPTTKIVQLPGVPADSDARVIAVSDTTTAVYLPTPTPVVNVVDDTGTTISSTALPGPVSSGAVASRAGDLVTWWTGDAVMVFEANGLKYKYTVTPVNGQAPVGPATLMAGRLLVPVTSGYDVFNPETGAGESHIAVQRPPSQSAVIPNVAGTTVLEQRGDTLVALA
ncbi:PQQ-binding-like beta-propeller repeat protein [Mycobacterium sp. Root135]|uniref:Rv3212 family protein n=1 Tax=Mycobacterium sp. Root135 TaxID=1736457 RepID=UPI001F17BA2A|nr:PQQ-binding-like beta-propeller repeat protein [Mycobacterium sp. Root135]